MKVAVLTGGFPSKDNPSKSIFNYRAVIGLMNHIDVTVFHFRYLKPGRKMVKAIVFEDVKVVTVSLPWIPIEFPFLNALNIILWQLLVNNLLRNRLEDFDILHSIGLETGLVVSLLAKKLDKKHVAQTIGSDLLIYLPKLENYFGLKKWILKTDGIVCNSKYLKKELLKQYPTVKAEVLYRGTDLKRFYRKTINIGSTITIVFLGGFSERKGSGMGTDLKGGETLKSIWKYFDAIKDLNVKIKLGGPSSDNVDQKVWRSKLNHPDRVDLLGLLNPDVIPKLITEADIILIPSKSEGLPNVAVEACASGALVIASEIGGIPEIVIDGYTGFTLDPHDHKLWVRTIEKVLNEFSSYSYLRQNAMNFTRENYDADNYPKNLITVYTTI